MLVVGIIGEYKLPSWHHRVKTFELLVLIGVAGELIADGGIFLFSRRLQSIGDLETADLTLKARQADERATANEKETAGARADAASSNALAKGFESKIADSNARVKAAEARIASANAASKEAVATVATADARIAEATSRAKGAEALVASAKAQAAKAELGTAQARLELAKLKSPRSLIDVPALISALAAFKNTEYTFSAVFEDEESLKLLKIVDDVLQRAGWKRTKPPGGFPAINVFGVEADFAVPAALTNGIRISVSSLEDLSVLQSLPSDRWPVQVRTAVALNLALAAKLSPPEELEQPFKVNMVKGESKVVQISIGKKP